MIGDAMPRKDEGFANRQPGAWSENENAADPRRNCRFGRGTVLHGTGFGIDPLARGKLHDQREPMGLLRRRNSCDRAVADYRRPAMGTAADVPPHVMQHLRVTPGHTGSRPRGGNTDSDHRRLLLESDSNARVGVVAFTANTKDGCDDGYGDDAGGDQAEFNRRGTRLVIYKTSDKRAHRSPSQHPAVPLSL